MRRILLLTVLLPALVTAQEVRTRIIDVGAGHASITKMPGPHYMVFDAGLSGRANHIIAQMRALMGTDNVVDLLVISHSDRDHLAAADEIIGAFDVKMVLRTGLERCAEDRSCPWRTTHNAIRAAVDSGETIDLDLGFFPIAPGYTFRFGEATAQMVSGFHTPPFDWNISGLSDFRNAGSIVIRLEYDGKPILFTGDEFGKEPGLNSPMKAAEKFMVDNQLARPIDSDVLIAAHHGGDDGSSTDFLKAVSPTFVIFPAGSSNQHPRQNVVTRMTRPDVGIQESNLFRTDHCDPPGSNKWRGAFVDGADDGPEDDDIDIVLTKGDPDPVVGYVTSALTCSP
jgi:beta-lactamase superfamily II metal-dependent hydrolase